MFERFTGEARQAVVAAQTRARERGAGTVRTEHLLAALYALPDSLAVRALRAFGVDREAVEAEVGRLHPATPPGGDAEALSALGIDLDEVRRQADEAFGPGALDRTRAARGREGGGRRKGHIPLERSTKKALELSLREAILLEHRHIGTEHLLLGLLHTETGAAHHILAARGLALPAVRAVVAELTRGGRRAG